MRGEVGCKRRALRSQHRCARKKKTREAWVEVLVVVLRWVRGMEMGGKEEGSEGGWMGRKGERNDVEEGRKGGTDARMG